MYTWAPCQPLPPSAAETQAQGLVLSPLEAEGTRLESLRRGWWKHLRPMPAQGERLWSWQEKPSPEAWAAVGVAAVVSVMACGGRCRGVWVVV